MLRMRKRCQKFGTLDSLVNVREVREPKELEDECKFVRPGLAYVDVSLEEVGR